MSKFQRLRSSVTNFSSHFAQRACNEATMGTSWSRFFFETTARFWMNLGIGFYFEICWVHLILVLEAANYQKLKSNVPRFPEKAHNQKYISFFSFCGIKFR